MQVKASVSQSFVSRATRLRDVVKTTLYPFAESRGFIRGRSRNSRLVTFRRSGPGTMQLFDVQWEKYGGASFVLRFGECPSSGIDMIDIGHVSAEEARAGWCFQGGSLQREQGPFGWFKLRKPLVKAIATLQWCYSPEEVVGQVIEYFDEVEQWWRDKKEGPHLYFIHRPG